MQWSHITVELETPPWKTLNPRDVDSVSQENYQEENMESHFNTYLVKWSD